MLPHRLIQCCNPIIEPAQGEHKFLSYRVHLQKFEGPLPLLLYLIRKEEMDIFDINIFEITTQYMEHIRLMKELDLEVAGDFVAMAATLLQIKSRMLLPNYNEDGEVLENDDPRKELVQMLLEYQKYQAAGKNLLKRYLLGRDVFARGETYRAQDSTGAVVIEADNALFALIGAYRRSIKKMKNSVHQVKAKTLSIASRILQFKDRLPVGERVLMSDIVAFDTRNLSYKEFRQTLLITFLSVLELGRLGFVSLFQNEVFSDLHIQAKSEIASSGLQRVQEFDSTENVGLSEKLFVSLADDEPHEKLREDQIVPASEQMNFSMASTDLTPRLSSDLADDLSLDEESEVSVSAATDEEIFEAELELSEEDESRTVIDDHIPDRATIEEAHQDNNIASNDHLGLDFEPEQTV
jgi:segregation and condensation protein A